MRATSTPPPCSQGLCASPTKPSKCLPRVLAIQDGRTSRRRTSCYRDRHEADIRPAHAGRALDFRSEIFFALRSLRGLRFLALLGALQKGAICGPHAYVPACTLYKTYLRRLCGLDPSLFGDPLPQAVRRPRRVDRLRVPRGGLPLWHPLECRVALHVEQPGRRRVGFRVNL